MLPSSRQTPKASMRRSSAPSLTTTSRLRHRRGRSRLNLSRTVSPIGRRSSTSCFMMATMSLTQRRMKTPSWCLRVAALSAASTGALRSAALSHGRSRGYRRRCYKEMPWRSRHHHHRHHHRSHRGQLKALRYTVLLMRTGTGTVTRAGTRTGTRKGASLMAR